MMCMMFLKIYGGGGKPLRAIKSFYEKASTCVKISGETSKHFEIKVDLRQGCVMLPWLFNIYVDGVTREMKGKIGEVGVRMYAEGRKWVLNSPPNPPNSRSSLCAPVGIICP